MHVAILTAKIGWHTDELSRALAERGHTSAVLPYEGLVARIGGPEGPPPRRPVGTTIVEADLQVRLGSSLSSEGTSILDADAVLARIIPSGSLEQIIYRVDTLHWIEQRGVPVINSPRAIERSVDKFYTTALLQEAGLPTPETVVCERTDDAMAAMKAMGDVIIKPIFGSLGHGMVRVSDPDVAFRVVRSFEQVRAVFYVQRAIDHDDRDVRVFVVGGRVLAAIERRAVNGDWRTNVARGGLARPFELPSAWEQLALRAAATVGADYAGVDLLPSRAGEVFVLEVNAIPGWKGLQQATGVNVAASVVVHLEGRVRPGEQSTSVAQLLA